MMLQGHGFVTLQGIDKNIEYSFIIDLRKQFRHNHFPFRVFIAPVVASPAPRKLVSVPVKQNYRIIK